MNKPKNEQEIVMEKVKQYFEEYPKFLKRLGLVVQPIINFPKSKNVPLLSRMAIKVIQKQGGILDTRFAIMKK